MNPFRKTLSHLHVRYMGLRILMQHCLQISEDCLLQHIQREHYQAVIWKRATTPIIDAPSLTDHGWKIDEEGNIDVV
jgi:hypothetical protein